MFWKLQHPSSWAPSHSFLWLYCVFLRRCTIIVSFVLYRCSVTLFSNLLLLQVAMSLYDMTVPMNTLVHSHFVFSLVSLRMPGQKGNMYIIFLNIVKFLSTGAVPFWIPNGNVWECPFLQSLINIVCFHSGIFANLIHKKWSLSVVQVCVSFSVFKAHFHIFY